MIEIRSLSPQDDWAAVGRLYVESWQNTYQRILPQRFLDKLTPDRWSAVVRADPGSSLGLFENGALTGTAMLGFPRQEGRGGYGEIISLYLLPHAQGQGHGRRLLEAALAQLREQGCENACLWVMSANTRAVFFYLRMGFRATGRMQQETYGSAAVELMEMEKPLY